MLWDVVVPSAMPELLNGIRTALALSFILLVSSELIVAQQGLGYLIGFLGANGVYDAMFAVVLTVAFLGFAADRALSPGHAEGAAMAGIEPRAESRSRSAHGPGRGCAAVHRLWGFARLSIVLLARALGVASRAAGAVTPFMLPPLAPVLERIWSDSASPATCLLNTRRSRSTAPSPASRSRRSAAIVLGMADLAQRLARWFFDPIISVGFPMPKIAFLPVIILWLGVYDMLEDFDGRDRCHLSRSSPRP